MVKRHFSLSYSNRRWIVACLLFSTLLAGCQPKKETDSKASDTIESTKISEMTELENDVFSDKIALLKENVEANKSTGEVSDSEMVYLTIQEIYTMNLSDEQKAEADTVINQLPTQFVEFQQAILLSKQEE